MKETMSDPGAGGLKQKPTEKITVRVAMALSMVALLAVVLFATLTLANTERLFSRYLREQRRSQEIRLAVWLAEAYRQTGSWERVLVALREAPGPAWNPLPQHPGRRGKGREDCMWWAPGGQRLLVVDEEGKTILDTGGVLRPGERLPARELAQGTPIQVAGARVGTVMVRRPPYAAVMRLENDFRRSVWLVTLLAALGAGAIAVFFSRLLSRRITRPLTVLATATAQIASSGDLGRRVPVPTRDEIGVLAQTFNDLLARLSASQELRRNLLADLAHELRTPVSILQGQLEAWQWGRSEPTPARIISLHDEVLRLHRLLEELRLLAVAEAQELPLRPEWLKLVDLQNHLRETIGPLAQAQGVGLVISLEELGPEAALWADRDRLRQILYNLLANALRHTPAGGRVSLTVRPAGDRGISLVVADNGEGIAAADLPHIFDRYYRGRQGEKEGPGLGLGLAIARALARAHGGELEAEINPGGGGIFILTLPRWRRAENSGES